MKTKVKYAHKVNIPQPLEVNYKKILVAVDYLASTPKIFANALTLAKISNGELMIFHCVQGEIPGMPEMVAYAGMGAYSGIYSRQMLDLEEKLLHEATEELYAWLGGFAKQASGEGITANYDYGTGEAGKQICTMAKNWGADLIVLGRRGRNGFSELLLGSVSNYVVHHASCSVLIVQQ